MGRALQDSSGSVGCRVEKLGFKAETVPLRAPVAERRLPVHIGDQL